MVRLLSTLAAVLFIATSFDAAVAQNPPAGGILADGNAAVTGFSGAQLPTLIAPGVNPADKIAIDLNGSSARVIDVQAPGAPPQGQLIAAPKPFTVTAGQTGQVFAVALDNATPPNIYVAATSVYGLPIVVPDAGGVPNRAQQGAPNARFMAGLFGPEAQQGGPGSIWRIDGASGAVSLFANVALDGVPNSGPALGGLAFDPASNSLFVADRETGMIHRLDMTGAERGRYDHGTQGRQAGGLPPVPFDQSTRLNMTSPSFQPANPETWGYAPPARRVFGLAVRDGRLYYAVAEGLQIWSVSISADAFGTDPRLELAVPSGQSASEISKIAFDDQGRMLLAERVAPSGAFDFAALTQTGGGRVLRFEPSGGALGQGWRPAAGDPETGIDAARSSNGGLAIGYGYDSAFRRNPTSCGGSLWWTGEQLLPGGPEAVNGLQGRPDGAAASWLIDYDDQLDDPQTRGHLGDMAILRPCAPGAPPAPQPPPAPQEGPPGPPPAEGPPPEGPPEGGPGPEEEEGMWWDDGPPPPPPICPAGMHLATNGRQCCPLGQIPGFTGGCQGTCSNGAPDPTGACWHGFAPGAAPAGAFVGTCWNGMPATKIPGCIPNNLFCNKCPQSPLKNCPAGFNRVTAPPGVATTGWLWSNATCVPSPAQMACGGGPGPNFCTMWGTCTPAGQIGLDGVCHAAGDICPAGQTAFPVNRCCLNGTAPDAHGACPGIPVPPLWYLDYLATGTGPCVPPACSFYEFTISGKERFGRGSLTQRITVPPGSAFTEARITRGSKYCPASRWSCSKTGDVFTCSAEDCGLEPGDQVVTRLEGQVAPNLTEPPPAPIEKTACGVLECRPMTSRGRAVTARPGAEQPGAPPRPETQQRTPEGGVPTACARACWTIRIVGRTPPPPSPCPPNYVSTTGGQCCLGSQMTTTGVCCPAGQRPDARRQACISTCPSDHIWTGAACACPPGTVERRGQCVREVIPPPQTCGPGQAGVWPNCCSLGTYWDGRHCTRGCPPDSVGTPPDCRCRPPLVGTPGNCIRKPEHEPCPLDSVGTQPNCRCRPPLVGTPGSCRQIEIQCRPGWHPVGRRCIPDQEEIRCPPRQHRVDRHCVPDVVECRPGWHRVDGRCMPPGRQPDFERFRRPRPEFERPRPPRPQFRRPSPSRPPHERRGPGGAY